MARRDQPRKPYTAEPWQNPDTGKWDVRIRAANNKIVYTTHNQGYNNAADALDPLIHLMHHGPHIVKDENGDVIPGPDGYLPPEDPVTSRRRLFRRRKG